jgi:hypothetical protein
VNDQLQSENTPFALIHVLNQGWFTFNECREKNRGAHISAWFPDVTWLGRTIFSLWNRTKWMNPVAGVTVNAPL